MRSVTESARDHANPLYSGGRNFMRDYLASAVALMQPLRWRAPLLPIS